MTEFQSGNFRHQKELINQLNFFLYHQLDNGHGLNYYYEKESIFYKHVFLNAFYTI